MIRPLSRLPLLLAFVAFSSFAAAAPAPAVIRFGEVGGANVNTVGGRPQGTGLVALALHLGFFEQEFGPGGPKIEQIYFAGTGPAQNEAMSQGAIDFGSWGGLPNVIGLSGRIPAHVLLTRRSGGAGNNYYVAVRPDSPVRTVADLKGKRISVSIGTNPYYSLITLLQDRGLSAKDVKLVNIQSNEAVVAFKAGSLDAIFGGVNLLLLRDKGDVRILEDTRSERRSQSVSGFLVNDKFEQTHPEVVAKVVKVVVKTSHWASEEANRETLLKFVSDRTFAWDYIRHDYEGSLLQRHNPLLDDWAVEAYRQLAVFAVEHRLIRRPVPAEAVRGWFKPQYLDAALRDLGLENYWPREPASAFGAIVPRP
jgi:sulfonate transport system substrate-binding protein